MNVALSNPPGNTVAQRGLRKGERTRRALIEAATHILCDAGYGALTVVSVAEAAGVRRNSFYTYFSDLNALIDELSTDVLNRIGRDTMASRHRGAYRSITIARLHYVLSLPDEDPFTAGVLCELYVHHANTAREIHRRLKRDIATDRRHGLVRAAGREADAVAVVAAAGTMERLRRGPRRRRAEDEIYLGLMARLCGLSPGD